MKVMEIKVKDETIEEFRKFILRLLEEMPAQNIRCTTNGSLFSLPLPDTINENLVRERIVQRYGSKVKVRIVEKGE
jgi:2-polyprenyl-6-methoxyphenol hydroxylase-like FAD-dependent oxidoreductase